VRSTITPQQAPEWVRDRLAGRPRPHWVGVDGLGAAGKTTLARRIVAELGDAALLSVDDFGRVGVRGWDRDLFVAQVLTPLLTGQPARYQSWDLVADRPVDWVDIPAGRSVVVEGVSCTDERVPVPWDVTLWVDAPESLRASRIQARDGAPLLERWRDDWLPNEQAYVAAQRPQERVDAIVADPLVSPARPRG
jgi:uridine kinase